LWVYAYWGKDPDPDPNLDPYKQLRNQIREAQKHTDPYPQHWFFSVSYPAPQGFGSPRSWSKSSVIDRNEILTYLDYLVVDLRWSRWVLYGDVVSQCCLRTCLASV
jgi:hypothetical protein